MNLLIGGFASLMGLLMDLFFRALTVIGYPRLWACVVLFAVATRFLFLPFKVGSHRKRIFGPLIQRDLNDINPDFFRASKKKELAKDRKAALKKIYKNYKISNFPGWVVTLLQLPFLIALFYVVKNPQQFVPSLETISAISPNTNTFFGISLDLIPQTALGNGGSYFVLIIPVIIAALTFLKMFSSVKSAKTVKQKIRVYTLCAVFVFLLAWSSFGLPLVISIYWAAIDLVSFVMDLIIPRCIKKNKKVKEKIDAHNAWVAQYYAEKEAKAAENLLRIEQEKLSAEQGQISSGTDDVSDSSHVSFSRTVTS